MKTQVLARSLGSGRISSSKELRGLRKAVSEPRGKKTQALQSGHRVDTLVISVLSLTFQSLFPYLKKGDDIPHQVGLLIGFLKPMYIHHLAHCLALTTEASELNC